MKIGYEELSKDLDEVIEARKKDPLSRYEVDIEGDMKTPTALRVLSVLDGDNDFEHRAQFVKELLTGCRVTVYKDGKKSFDVGFTPGTEWWSVDGFNKDPMALRYLVTCVYTKFLKKFVA